MGDYTIRIHAVGGHGCQREVKTSEVVTGCGQPSCPDCNARAFVEKLKATGNDVKSAVLTHWPAEIPGYSGQDEVRDNLLTGRRKGSF